MDYSRWSVGEVTAARIKNYSATKIKEQGIGGPRDLLFLSLLDASSVSFSQILTPNSTLPSS